MSLDMVLELRVEEIPAGMQEGAAKQLQTLFEGLLKEQNIAGDVKLERHVTPNRLVLLAGGLPEKSNSYTEEKRGPKLAAGLDESGHPTRALSGFMQSVGVASADELDIEETDKGQFFFYKKQVDGQSLSEILSNEMPVLLGDIGWPKSMRWGAGDTAFVRPIENICCVLGGDVVPFEFAGVAACNQAWGHSFLAPEKFTVTSVDQYQQELAARHVVLDRDARKETIVDGFKNIEKSVSCNIKINASLLSEVVGLVEWPVVMHGTFDKAFLALPPEVLEITMAEHQRFFAVEEGGELTNRFAAVSNVGGNKDLITNGYEKVLTARFNDARFYWEQDVQAPLADNLTKLQDVVFQQQLGSVADKVMRMQQLAGWLAPHLKAADVAQVERAVTLSRCDLVTGTVGEFPELQGLIGSYLAEQAGEAPEVVDALRYQYENQQVQDLGAVAKGLVLADRMDTLVGFFGIDQPPTGSKDPFALRRSALTVLRLLHGGDGIRLPLRALIAESYKTYDGRLSQSLEQLSDTLMTFFMGRLQVMLKEEGIGHDRVEAVFALGLDDVVDITRRVRALQAFLSEESGAALTAAFKRAGNILAKAGEIDARVEQSVLQDAAEQKLFEQCQHTKDEIEQALGKEDYQTAMQKLADLRAPVDAFFDGVMVMADDESLRRNRLALLADMHGLFTRIARFDRLTD